MKKKRDELVEEIRKYGVENYRYVMCKPGDGINWFLLFNFEGGRLRVSPINYEAPEGASQAQIEKSAQTIHDDLFRNGNDDAVSLTAPLEVFLSDIKTQFGGDEGWQETVLQFILSGIKNLRAVIYN